LYNRTITIPQTNTATQRP